MARGAGEPSAKRAKVDEADEEEDPLVRRKEEVVRLLKEARSREDARAERVARRELLTMCADFEADGFAVGIAATFGEGQDSVVGRISPGSIKTALGTLAKSAAGGIDAIFVSCTSLKCASIIAAAEAELGIPVISSNSALAWDMARFANVPVGGPVNGTGKGMLFA